MRGRLQQLSSSPETITGHGHGALRATASTVPSDAQPKDDLAVLKDVIAVLTCARIIKALLHQLGQRRATPVGVGLVQEDDRFLKLDRGGKLPLAVVAATGIRV